ncbi:hypothetical protein [Bacillus sp. 1P06AnD]|uniref:hypothetical protein n=1 Tax=Bacillus sp. 1P06AnD TaxID=3132208 RepID=UPI0039A1A604
MKEEEVISSYLHNEQKMILIYAQWCTNNDIDAQELYRKAYPSQEKNPLLTEAITETLPKNESTFISQQLVIDVLAAFGNEDLAFAISKMKLD